MPKTIKVKVQVYGAPSGPTRTCSVEDREVEGRPLTPHFAAIPFQTNHSDRVVAGLWNVTHLPTGKKVATVRSLKRAKWIAHACEECMPNVESSDPDAVAKGADPKLLEYRQALDFFRDGGSLTWEEFKARETGVSSGL